MPSLASKLGRGHGSSASAGRPFTSLRRSAATLDLGRQGLPAAHERLRLRPICLPKLFLKLSKQIVSASPLPRIQIHKLFWILLKIKHPHQLVHSKIMVAKVVLQLVTAADQDRGCNVPAEPMARSSWPPLRTRTDLGHQPPYRKAAVPRSSHHSGTGCPVTYANVGSRSMALVGVRMATPFCRPGSKIINGTRQDRFVQCMRHMSDDAAFEHFAVIGCHHQPAILEYARALQRFVELVELAVHVEYELVVGPAVLGQGAEITRGKHVSRLLRRPVPVRPEGIAEDLRSSIGIVGWEEMEITEEGTR